MTFSFTYSRPHASSFARLGELVTPHGVIQTPAFIFCATKAAMKAVDPRDVKEADTQIILSNTYHLMIQPGSKIVAQMGGLHKFMGWDGPMLTDSGGFQIFSLGHGSVANEIKGRRLSASGEGTRNKTLRKITEEGATFRSYLNGKLELLTPERSIQIQRDLGADLIVVLDECSRFHVDKRYTRRSMELSHRWAQRSFNEFERTENGKQALYGIIQGGVYEDLRQESCDFVNSQAFFGHAIGGSLGDNKEQMYDVVRLSMSKLDPQRPVHLLGIGGISDIFECVKAGVDTFDCVHPTRLARHGGALVAPHNRPEGKEDKEHINLKNGAYRVDPTPIEPDCTCSTCRRFSKAYIHHLLKAQEILALSLISVHNIHFMNKLLSSIRTAIANGTLEEEQKNWV